MTKLITILREILEASLSNDANKSVQAKEFIKKINNLISNYKSDNKEIKVKGLSSLSFVEITFPEFFVNLMSINKGSTKAFHSPGKDGKKTIIDVYRCNIHQDPKLEVEFDESALYHELVHFLSKDKLDTTSKSKGGKNDYSGYINHPIEVNAHFFQYFMPDVVKFIEKEKHIPDKFDDFFKDITKDPKAKEFIDDLDEKNKKKVMKRLGTYYNDILKNPDFKIEKGGNVDDQQLKKATNGFVSKLKRILKIK